VSFSLGFVEVGILILMLFALTAVVIVFLLPRRIRPADVGDHPEVREAYRANLIQIMTLLLVVLGASVGLEQLAASVDQLQEARLDQLAGEVESAEERLTGTDSDEQTRLDAIADLAALHTKSPELRFRIERDLLRFVQSRARLTDLTTLSAPASPPPDIQRALDFLLTKGQEHQQLDRELTGQGRGLVLANLDLRGMDLREANISGADLRGTLLWGADLRHARMDGAVLTGAGLQHVKLQHAVLRGSVLTEVDVGDASLTGTDLTDADLRGVRGLTWGQVRDATISCSTQLPSLLPASSAEAAPAEPMMLVLRDCLVPGEIQLPPHANAAIHFSSGLSEAVVVQVPQLGIDARVPDRTQVVEATVNAEPGRYSVRAQAEQGATYGEGTLIVTADALMVSQSMSEGETASVATPRAAAPLQNATPVATAAAELRSDRDCDDFLTQVEAQAFYEAAGGPELDLHRLDVDGDGIACAS
jgi:hypothetical protein